MLKVIAWVAVAVAAVLIVLGFTDPTRVLLIFVGLVVLALGTIPYTMTRRRRR